MRPAAQSDASYNASYRASYFLCEMCTATARTSAHVLSDMRGWGGPDWPIPYATHTRCASTTPTNTPTKSYSLSAMCWSPWSWSQQYPNGYPACHSLGPNVLGMIIATGPTPPSVVGVV